MGGEWFLNNQDDTFLNYEYNFIEKKHSEKHHGLREMGALWSITQLSKYLHDDRYVELAEKGLKFFEKGFQYDTENDFYYVVILQKGEFLLAPEDGYYVNPNVPRDEYMTFIGPVFIDNVEEP